MTIVDHEGDDGIRHFGAILIVDFLIFLPGLARVLDSFQSTYIPSIVAFFFLWSRSWTWVWRRRMWEDLSIT